MRSFISRVKKIDIMHHHHHEYDSNSSGSSSVTTAVTVLLWILIIFLVVGGIVWVAYECNRKTVVVSYGKSNRQNAKKQPQSKNVRFAAAAGQNQNQNQKQKQPAASKENNKKKKFASASVNSAGLHEPNEFNNFLLPSEWKNSQAAQQKKEESWEKYLPSREDYEEYIRSSEVSMYGLNTRSPAARLTGLPNPVLESLNRSNKPKGPPVPLSMEVMNDDSDLRLTAIYDATGKFPQSISC